MGKATTRKKVDQSKVVAAFPGKAVTFITQADGTVEVIVEVSHSLRDEANADDPGVTDEEVRAALTGII